MKTLILSLLLLVIIPDSKASMLKMKSASLNQYSSEVPFNDLRPAISKYLLNELGYEFDFKSDYTLAEYVEINSGKKWYILDGYYTLNSGDVLFLDFNYDPATKEIGAINNYTFVPKENERFLLKADEVCNPYKRHFIGSLFVEFKNAGHFDEMMNFLAERLGAPPIIYSYNSKQHIVQDLTASIYKPLFTLHENELIQEFLKFDYIKNATLIPSGRNPSNENITQEYVGLTEACRK